MFVVHITVKFFGLKLINYVETSYFNTFVLKVYSTLLFENYNVVEITLKRSMTTLVLTFDPITYV